jgi:nicotinamide-nucleotide adenylyltransferase
MHSVKDSMKDSIEDNMKDNMKNIMKALFIGRFQPFHFGHLQIVKRILKEQKKIIIAIGSSQESYTLNNPFTADERREMIERTLNAENISTNNYKICFVPDLGKHEKWVEHVISITGRIDVIYTGSELTKQLFAEKGYKIIDLPRIENISATDIREKITCNKSINKLVHHEVSKYLQEINANKRLKK